MGYDGKEPKKDSIILADRAATTVSNPVGGLKVINRNGLIYKKDSSGNESQIGGGAGGAVEYIENGNAESSTDGWATYADAAGEAPVDGTGGSPTVTWTRNTTTPLRGQGDFAFTKDAANRQGEGVSYDFTIDQADLGKVLGLWMDVDASDANYVDEDARIYIVDRDTGAVITPQSPEGKYKLIRGKYRERISFAPADVTSTNYRLCIHQASVSALAYVLKFDNISVSPGFVSPSFDGIWKTYTEDDVTLRELGPTALDEVQGWLQPYRDTSGNWRLKFNITGKFAGTETTQQLEIVGATFAAGDLSTAGLTKQPVAAFSEGMLSAEVINAYVVQNSSTVFMQGNNSEFTFNCSGDVQLADKPTWVDFDPIGTIYPETNDLALGPWKEYTPITNGMGTIASRLQWRRNGQNVEIVGDWTNDSSLTADEARIGLPNGYTAKLLGTTGTALVGKWQQDGSSTFNEIGTVLATDGDTYVNFGRNASTVNENSMTPNDANQFWGASSRVSVFISVPVAEFDTIGQVPPIGLQIANKNAYGLVRSTSVLNSQDETFIANNTVTDVGSGTLTLPAGKYALRFGGACRINWTVLPSYVSYQLRILTVADGGVGDAIQIGVPRSGSTQSRAVVSGGNEFTFAVETELKLSTIIAATGGTVSNRAVFEGYIIATPID